MSPGLEGGRVACEHASFFIGVRDSLVFFFLVPRKDAFCLFLGNVNGDTNAVEFLCSFPSLRGCHHVDTSGH